MKTFVFLGLLLRLSFSTHAQQHLEFSLGYSSNLTFFTDRPILKSSANPNLLAQPLPSHNFVVDGTVGYMTSKSFGIISGAGWMRLQQHYSLGFPQPSTGKNALYTRDLTYLRIPLLARIQVAITDKWMAYAQAGFYGDILMASSQSLNVGSNTIATEDISDTYRKFTMGLCIQLGVMYLFTPSTSIMLGIQSSSSFTTPGGGDIHSSVYGSNSPTITHNTSDLYTVGLRIGLRQTINLHSTP